MSDNARFDFWYAVNNTEVVLAPERRLETFGATVLNYHLVTELLDSVNRCRVREGRIEAHQPEIVTPQSFAETLLDGFGDEASRYAEWLRAHERDLHILKYGFMVRKQETSEHIVSDPLPTVVERVRKALAESRDPLAALAIGVDQPWEVCLLKLMVEVVEHSVAGNVRDLKRRNAFNLARLDPVRRQIEEAFQAAAHDAAAIGRLGHLLQQHGLFKEYEDRFFSLVRSQRGG
jgi:hypothetical protein